ncbi:MAG: DUF3617 family protein [Dissulfurispiraceae bacterium]
MNRLPGIIFIFACCVLWAAMAFAAPDIQDGLWEITATVEMPGMQEGMMQPVTHTACMTQNNAVPDLPAMPDCKVTDMEDQGNSVSWTVTCANVVSKGNVTYSGSTFNGATEMTMNTGGEIMQVKSKIAGRRIGPCK